MSVSPETDTLSVGRVGVSTGKSSSNDSSSAFAGLPSQFSSSPPSAGRRRKNSLSKNFENVVCSPPRQFRERLRWPSPVAVRTATSMPEGNHMATATQTQGVQDSAPRGLLWDAHEAAAQLKVSVKHLSVLARRGVVPSVRLGARRLYSPAALKEFIEAQQCSA